MIERLIAARNSAQHRYDLTKSLEGDKLLRDEYISCLNYWEGQVTAYNAAIQIVSEGLTALNNQISTLLSPQ